MRRMSNLATILNFQYSLAKKKETILAKWPLPLKDTSRQLSGGLRQTFVLRHEEMRRVFDKIDRDGDGKLSPGDLRWLLQISSGAEAERVAKAEAREMVAAADADGDGYVSFREFMEVHRKGVTAAEIQRAFRAFDADGDGRIGADEVMTVMRRVGERCSLEECRRMVREVDRSRAGLVDMEDFVAMMTCTMKSV